MLLIKLGLTKMGFLPNVCISILDCMPFVLIAISILNKLFEICIAHLNSRLKTNMPIEHFEEQENEI